MTNEETRCGFISVIGRPNAGKSTLINDLVGSKISIVSRKVQTTRSRILGIALNGASQLVLIDTPGIFSPKKTLEEAMVSAALNSYEEADIIVHLVDAAAKNPVEANTQILSSLEGRKNVILVLNKIDRIEKEKLLALAEAFNQAHPYMATFMISALTHKGVDRLSDYLAQSVPEGVWMYPEDQMSDMPLRLMAAEITREKIFDQLHQEIPYSVFVETESWEQFDNGSVKISQVIYVQKESQKGIVLGKGGQKIKQIGRQAREDIAKVIDQPVHLKTFVRVQPDWAERAENYEMFGLELPQ